MRATVAVFLLVWCVACGDDSQSAPDAGDTGGHGGNAAAGAGGLSGASGTGSGGQGGDGGLAPPVMDGELLGPEAITSVEEHTCEGFERCGGNLVGKWLVRDYCFTDLLSLAVQGLPRCAGVVTSYRRDVAGSVNFTVDGALEIDLDVIGTQHMVLDDECIATLGEFDKASVEACTSFASRYNDAAPVASCIFQDARCECDISTLTKAASSGTYEVDGEMFDDGTVATPFCVTDDTLGMRMAAGMMRSLDLTLERASNQCAEHRVCGPGKVCCIEHGDAQCADPAPDADYLCALGEPLGIPDGEACPDDRYCLVGSACVDGMCTSTP